MNPEILLAQLRALLERAPDFDQYTSTSREHMVWLAQGHALVSRWNGVEAISYKTAWGFLPMDFTRANNVASIFGIIHRAIADLEFMVPQKDQVAFAAGEVYDFFKELKKVIESADSTIFIIDPYLDHTVFDNYLNSRKKDVQVRLLLNKGAEDVKSASEKYIQQRGNVLEIKKSNKIHDRVIFIDDYVCWVVGQSLKDAAKAKPTYLAPLSPDVVSGKLEDYNELWGSANAI